MTLLLVLFACSLRVAQRQLLGEYASNGELAVTKEFSSTRSSECYNGLAERISKCDEVSLSG